MSRIAKVFEMRRAAVRWLVGRYALAQAPPAPHRSSIYDWLGRYGIAECAGIACALLVSLVVRQATHSSIAAAYGAAWAESIGYSSVIITRDFLAESRAARAALQRFDVRRAGGVMTGLFAEFGPAGFIDTVVTRPLMMGLGVRMFGSKLGVVAGKVVADILFYVPVIFIYERRKRRTVVPP